jgi:3-keto-5-aminohexanoate cleavage enzyme
MDPLVITATPNISWLHPQVPYPRTPETIAEEARLCRERGAAILHIHAEGQWQRLIRAIRDASGLIVQCGMSSQPIPQRMEIYEARADMISIILSHHDEAFAETECLVLHPRQELEQYASLCSRYGVIPEWEVWHAGSIWNLNYLIGKGLLRPPHVTTLFFGWPGGTWSPPTVEEYLYRRSLIPPDCVVNASIMGSQQRDILAAAIILGDHVRVGTEDYPYLHDGRSASTHELVEEAAAMARALGRPPATVEEARRIIGLA